MFVATVAIAAINGETEMICPIHGVQSTFCKFCDADIIEASKNESIAPAPSEKISNNANSGNPVPSNATNSNVYNDTIKLAAMHMKNSDFMPFEFVMNDCIRKFGCTKQELKAAFAMYLDRG